MEVRLLGPVDVLAEDGSVVTVPGQKLQLLLAALAAERGKVVSRDRLVDILYGDAPPRQPANSLQVLVSRLRRALGAARAGPLIETSDAGYALAAANSASGTDVERFDLLVRQARGVLADDPVRAAAALRAALALVRGEPLAGLPAEGWVRAERSQLAEARLAAVEDRIDADLASGGHPAVVAELEQLTAEHPLRERLWAQFVLALYRCGRQADALRAFQDARNRLIDELGIEPGAELRRLEAGVLAQDPALDPPGARPQPTGGVASSEPVARLARRPTPGDDDRPAARGNVPRPLTSCLGRERELADVLDLVESHRLVTLVGPGGVGKTRLAIDVAHTLAPATPAGVWMVDLAGVAAADGVLLALVRTLGLDEAVLAGTLSPRSVDEVASALADRDIVLLVDNCEHVVDDVAAVAETLLARCPELRVLATSRETLGVPGEFLFVVPPLPLETAVELFIERMAAGGRSDVVADDRWPAAVTEICARLDGLPLAVELAAARARHLDVVELAERLDERFELLVEAPRTAQPRQRTLRAVVDWSYELLDDEERRVFERLSVFAGGTTLGAARRVCADGDVRPDAVEAVLGRLVDKSLVTLDRATGSMRFGMLQTLADYAGERLAERDDGATARRHAVWAYDLTGTVVITRPEGGRVDQVRPVQSEAANLQRAIGWALAHDPLLALEMATNLGWHWFTTMQAGLAWSVLTTALGRADDAPDELVARAQALAGLAGVVSGHREQALGLAEAAYPIEQRLGDPVRLGWHCFLRAVQHVFVTEARVAATWLAEARSWFSAAGDEHGLSAVDFQQGVVAGLLGDLAEANGLLVRARDACRRTGNHMTLMATLARLGEVAERQARPDEAYAAWDELRGLATAAAVPALVTLASAGMALVRLDAGDGESATRLAAEAMATSHEGFSPIIGGYALAAWGTAQAAYGDRRLGVERVHEAAGLFSRIGYHGGAAECWWRLSQVSAEHGDATDAQRCAEHAVECAALGDDLVAREQARSQLEAVRRLAS
jgi:predicted ATPase/DNA-binding SARP family transcriptional activator